MENKHFKNISLPHPRETQIPFCRHYKLAFSKFIPKSFVVSRGGGTYVYRPKHSEDQLQMRLCEK